MDPSLYDRGVRELRGPDAALVEASPCPVCDARRVRPRFEIEGLVGRIVVCVECGLGRLAPLPTDAEIAALYPSAYYGATGQKFEGPVEAVVRLVGARHVRFLARGLPAGARVLDLGCGRGVLLAALADRGLEVHGVEMNADAAHGADPRAEIRIAPRLRDAEYPAAFFDEVIVWHVLEHLRDPRGTLEEIRRILRPGGRLVLAVPNFSSAQARWAGAAWFHLDVPRHLYHFPVSALRRLLGRTGYRCESEHHFSLRQNPFGWVQSALNRYTELPRNGLYVLLHRRQGDEPPPYDARTRRRLRLAYRLGLPIGIALCGAETILRSGATVHLIARAEGPSQT
ncbi:MAG: class I SAM-dependent methyltransferase [Deltaproteobacteria bacterium]|nr:MAG: class I SAM-dependent methyltransferase [Deltaproteobacteria bacterium]